MTGAIIMPEILCQQALERVLIYLGDDGVALTTDTCRQALRLVETSMAQGAGQDLPARCIDSLPDYFERSCDSIPDCSPPLKRGHIGYE
ncbi:hypothetical protein [Marinobacter orientalis]|uniref:Uncharacterized protein n=1 Tax=Marinobacter orientalis TaxID=1928859 RepID=A0A7Y0RCQ7_9GAMM|nr:hypothetical protein [Marinobacter orientalis]NMT63825.1 hypothetical protein [Marinobacter orientalis]TGX49929.1 hypothetical protein DIT72_09475 [Marinobacter orientalis]